MGMHIVKTSHTVKKDERGTQILPTTGEKKIEDIAHAQDMYEAWKVQSGTM